MKISVVIPVFGARPFLIETLQSLAPARDQIQEVIIVDDGSPRPFSLSEVPDSLRASLPLVALRQDNRGLSGARNFAITQAKSEFILPLDEDDLLVGENLKDFAAALAGSPAGIAYGNFQRFGEDHSIAECLPWEKLKLTDFNGLPYCSLYRKSVWEKVGGYDEGLRIGAEDWQFWIKCREFGVRGIYVPKTIMNYRVHGGSFYLDVKKDDTRLKSKVVLSFPQAFPESVRQWAAIVDQLPSPEVRNELCGAWKIAVGRMPTPSQCLLDQAIVESQKGNYETACHLLFQAIRLDESGTKLQELDKYAASLERAVSQRSVKNSLKHWFRTLFSLESGA